MSTMYPRPVFAITLSTIYRNSRPSCNSNTVWNDSTFCTKARASQCRRCTLVLCLQSHYQRSIASLVKIAIVIQCEMILPFVRKHEPPHNFDDVPSPVFAITLSTIYHISSPSCNRNTVWNDSTFTKARASQCRRCTLVPCLQSHYRRSIASLAISIT